ncbi:tetraacyldisaccharide 4'-kinase [Aquiflexum sp.]|uniref:tetraacyldisaccharide 4'-kinase n=1 Tax=Aquiflexum sp. TaxID=1872584 RepID=UPI0035945D92
MRWYDPLLYPFAAIYDGITYYRNRMFETGNKKSISFSIPTVVVGNLNLGGSGKTPMVEFLIELLLPHLKIATLSRGYGRKTKGFLMASKDLGPSEIGDEPFQIYEKFGKSISVAVGEKRILAIPEIIKQKPQTDLILLDDAFQHRYVKGDFNILLTTFQKPFFKDRILPLGTLRENINGAKRADVIIVTKCLDHLSESDKVFYITEINKITNVPVLFSGIEYGDPVPIFDPQPKSFEKVILVSGIANQTLFVSEVKRRFQVVETITFEDHHRYKEADLIRISNLVKKHQDCMILTTEKDAVKLKNKAFYKYVAEFPIFALPIKIKLIEKDKKFLFDQITKIVKDKAYIREI